jgi:NitT/TauT family transport system substrate-binding protein
MFTESGTKLLKRLPTGWRILIIALVWLGLITWLHLCLNGQATNRPTVLMGYMPVVANLACPLLDYASKEQKGLRFEALKFSSFAEMGEALRKGDIQAAFIIAPLSIVLHRQGADVRIVYVGNRHESTLVYRKDLNVNSFADLAGKTIAVPLRYSGHNLCVRRLAEQFGIPEASLNIVEINPPDMAAALAVGSLDAYFVGEPFAARTILAGESKVLYYVEQVWPDFICNLMIVRKDYIDKHPDRVRLLVQGAARSGLWASKHPEEAAKIASKYWNQPVEPIEYALTQPPNRIVYDRFVPKEDEIRFMADLMVHFSLLTGNDISGLVCDKFALEADLNGITDFESILQPPDAKTHSER